MLSAGTNVEWLRDDLGIIATAAESHDVASACTTPTASCTCPPSSGSAHPAGTTAPGAPCSASPVAASARRSSGPCSKGVAQRGADLVESAEADTGLAIPLLRVDGGMSDNPTFVQALADATQRPVEVSPVKEATTLGAAFLAGLAIGTWGGWTTSPPPGAPHATVEPRRAARP